MIVINKEVCKSCEYCVRFCPKHVLKVGTQNNKKGYRYVVLEDEKNCISCGICATMCPDAAISVFR